MPRRTPPAATAAWLALVAWAAACTAPAADRPGERVATASAALAGCAADAQGPGDMGGGWMGLRADGSVWVGSPAQFEPALGLRVKALAGVEGETLSRCAVTNDDSLWCWGNNAYGQLGDGTKNDAEAPQRVDALGAGVLDAGVSPFFACAARAGGEAWCWGRNEVGELGDGTRADRLTPGPVPSLDGVTSVTVGFDHACALKNDGSLWCWGGDLYGQVGAGSAAAAGRPTPVRVLDGVERASAGGFFTCAVRTDHSLWCWGDNADGHLGIGSTSNVATPQWVEGLGAEVRDVDTAVRAACAVKLDGSVWCWGYRGNGRLGDGRDDATKQLTPAPVSGPLGAGGATAVRVSEGTGCALGPGGALWCWGAGGFVDGTGSSRVPVAVDLCSLPRLDGVTPATGWEGGGGPAVTLRGADFAAGATVLFGDKPAASVTFVDATTVRAVPPAHWAATVDVTLVNPGGARAVLKKAFAFVTAPNVYGLEPSSSPAGGGVAVTLAGAYFLPGVAVSFGGTASPNVTIDSPTQLTAVAPPHAPGAVDVVVTNPDGQSDALEGAFSYLPGGGGHGGNGQGGDGGAGQAGNGQGGDGGAGQAGNGQGGDGGAGQAGNAGHGAGGGGGSGGAGGDVSSPPELYELAPAKAKASGGDAVVLSGKYFAPGITVTFGGVSSPNVVVDSPTRLTAVAPAHDPGPVDVVIADPAGHADALVGAFRYVAAPRVDEVLPATGPAAGGTSVTLTGAGFDYTTTVRIGGAATDVTLVDETTLRAKTAAHAPGGVDVEVANDDGQSGTLAGAFTFVAGAGAGGPGAAGTSGDDAPGGGTTTGGAAGGAAATDEGGAAGESQGGSADARGADARAASSCATSPARPPAAPPARALFAALAAASLRRRRRPRPS